MFPNFLAITKNIEFNSIPVKSQRIGQGLTSGIHSVRRGNDKTTKQQKCHMGYRFSLKGTHFRAIPNMI
jgi:hypothetical protein